MKLPTLKKKRAPSVKQQKKFAEAFTPEQWEACTEIEEFRDLLFVDIEEARRMAVNILQGDYRPKDPEECL